MDEQGFRTTRRRFFGGLIALAGASTACGAGTVAYFSDTETSSNNTISGGTIELSFGGSGTFEFSTALAPTNKTEESVTLLNDGTVDGSLDIDVSYAESDETNNDEDVSALDVAENLEIVTLEYDETNLLTADQNLSGTPTLHELSENNQASGESTGNDLVDLPNPDSSADGGTSFTVGLRLKEVGNSFQNDGVSITFDFHLNQNDKQ